MIYFFSGTPGSGKSLDMARCILLDLRNNRPVIANFAVNPPKRYKKKLLLCMEDTEIKPKFLYEFSQNYFKSHKFHEGAIVLYLDECQILFNSRTWNERGRADWLKFFTNHRHFGYDIVLASQFDRMIDRQIRAVIEHEVIHRKVNQMGIKGLFFRVLFCSPTLFLKISYYYPTKDKLSVTFFRYSKRWASIYNSYSHGFVLDKSENEVATAPDPVATEREETDPAAVQVSFANLCKSKALAYFSRTT